MRSARKRLAEYLLAGTLGLLPVPAVAQSDAWHMTSFGGGNCIATLRQNDVRTRLAIERGSNGRIDLRLEGLRQADANEDPRGLLMLYPAQVAVSLNGETRYTADFLKTSGWLELKDVGAERLRDLSPPGQLVFDVKGQSGQHEVESLSSPGLAPGIEFIANCAGG